MKKFFEEYSVEEYEMCALQEKRGTAKTKQRILI